MTGSSPTRSRTAASLAENPYAGQGPVLLDIGTDTGALVVHTDPELLGAEIEIVAGLQPPRDGHPQPAADAGHRHLDQAGHGHSHRGQPHGPHAEVLARPLPDGTSQPCVVYPDLAPGWYTLQVLPLGDSRSMRVQAGTVTFVSWPSLPQTA